MTKPRIALIGLGKMGRAVMLLAEEHGWPVVAALNAAAGGPTRARLGEADVAIEFTTPAAAPATRASSLAVPEGASRLCT